ncbi:hypothetical protein F3087_40405 [Nocardia colli]|uniref:Inositol monophosphatase n=1 Tax=Nocardia colli TaxID=2545717 RepID=A0A5N0DX37_9NOCA|nr:inositol monophosphatase family protein [Nocardia colli]KAA8880585.1 hypothetical protein F3087_40405 [Nocardia colli]
MITSFAASLISVAYPEIKLGYENLLRTFRADSSMRDSIGRVGPAAILVSDEPAIVALQKTNREFVTDAEIRAERLLRDAIGQRYPGHTLTGEELPVQARGDEWVWSIDPVDGTSAMIRSAIMQAYGLPIPEPAPAFGISIGVLHGNEAVCGVIAELLPRHDSLELGRVWVGSVDTPALCDGRAVQARAATSLNEAVLACTVPEIMFSTPERWSGFQALADATRSVVTDQNCIGFMGLLDGTVDIVCERDLLLPDAAAVVPILRSAGITVTDHDGYLVEFDATARKGEYCLLAARPELHRDAVVMHRRGVPRWNNRFPGVDSTGLGYVRKVD